jgi:hypothetical protein
MAVSSIHLALFGDREASCPFYFVLPQASCVCSPLSIAGESKICKVFDLYSTTTITLYFITHNYYTFSLFHSIKGFEAIV